MPRARAPNDPTKDHVVLGAIVRHFQIAMVLLVGASATTASRPATLCLWSESHTLRSTM